MFSFHRFYPIKARFPLFQIWRGAVWCFHVSLWQRFCGLQGVRLWSCICGFGKVYCFRWLTAKDGRCVGLHLFCYRTWLCPTRKAQMFKRATIPILVVWKQNKTSNTFSWYSLLHTAHLTAAAAKVLLLLDFQATFPQLIPIWHIHIHKGLAWF